MKKIIRLLQASCLLAALGMMSVSFLPGQAEAQIGLTCEEKGCDGGSYRCGIGVDPNTGQSVQCTLSCT